MGWMRRWCLLSGCTDAWVARAPFNGPLSRGMDGCPAPHNGASGEITGKTQHPRVCLPRLVKLCMAYVRNVTPPP